MNCITMEQAEVLIHYLDADRVWKNVPGIVTSTLVSRGLVVYKPITEKRTFIHITPLGKIALACYASNQ